MNACGIVFDKDEQGIQFVEQVRNNKEIDAQIVPENIHYSLIETINRPDKTSSSYGYYSNYYVYNSLN